MDRFETTPRQLILYLSGLTPGKTLRFPVLLRARFPVRALIPPAVVYEYYNPTVEDKTKPVEMTVVAK